MYDPKHEILSRKYGTIQEIDPFLNQIILLNFWFGFLSEWAN